MSANDLRGERSRDDERRPRKGERRVGRPASAPGGDSEEGDLAIEGAGLFGRYRPRNEREDGRSG